MVHPVGLGVIVILWFGAASAPITVSGLNGQFSVGVVLSGSR